MSHKKQSMTPGIILIAIGTFFLLRRFIDFMPYWERFYPVLILIFSGFLLWEAIRTGRPNPMFWGSFLACIGAFLLLRNYDLIPYLDFDELWPVIFIALGVSFLLRFIVNPRDWGVLIPCTLFLFFGLKNLACEMSDLYWEHDMLIDQFWPLILIVIGSGVVISGLHRHREHDKTDPS
ncbi:hypothetical protein JW948_17075 [bacterium]|nr:hypothetical protein [bacterium]